MLVKCEVPASPKTYEDELRLVSELALKGYDFETPKWVGRWATPKVFMVHPKMLSIASFRDSGHPANAALMWLSEYKQWYKPRNGVVGEGKYTGPSRHYLGHIPTAHWDPQPLLVDWSDLNALRHIGPDGLAAQKLGIMTDKLAQLKARWE